MTKTTTIIAFSIVLALVVGIASSITIADAIKPESTGETQVSKTVELSPVGGPNIDITLDSTGSNLLFHGDVLCQITWDPSVRQQWYIEFATETTVLDQTSCGTPSAAINIVGDHVDAVFQPGDFLILQDHNEIYRSQTP